jgi:hypothetical protein
MSHIIITITITTTIACVLRDQCGPRKRSIDSSESAEGLTGTIGRSCSNGRLLGQSAYTVSEPHRSVMMWAFYDAAQYDTMRASTCAMWDRQRECWRRFTFLFQASKQSKGFWGFVGVISTSNFKIKFPKQNMSGYQKCHCQVIVYNNYE